MTCFLNHIFFCSNVIDRCKISGIDPDLFRCSSIFILIHIRKKPDPVEFKKWISFPLIRNTGSSADVCVAYIVT